MQRNKRIGAIILARSPSALIVSSEQKAPDTFLLLLKGTYQRRYGCRKHKPIRCVLFCFFRGGAQQLLRLAGTIGSGTQQEIATNCTGGRAQERLAIAFCALLHQEWQTMGCGLTDAGISVRDSATPR